MSEHAVTGDADPWTVEDIRLISAEKKALDERWVAEFRRRADHGGPFHDDFLAVRRDLDSFKFYHDPWVMIETLLAEIDRHSAIAGKAVFGALLESGDLAARIASAVSIIKRHNHADLMSDDEWAELRLALELDENPTEAPTRDATSKETGEIPRTRSGGEGAP